MTDNASSPTPTHIAILGLGSMGHAILAGLRSPQSDLSVTLSVTNASTAKAALWEAEPDVTAYATEANPDANTLAVTGAQVVIAAVKPWQIQSLLTEIGPALSQGAIVVSVAAGIPTATMEAALPEHVSVLRAMPNTPALVGRGVTGVCAGSRASDDDVNLVRRLFAAVGDVVVVDESQMDALGALSGSGPAYVFYMIEQVIASARAAGFSDQDARTLVLGTVAGAAELLIQTGEQPAELRRRVTSPNGTTERAIAVLEDANLRQIFDAAMDAAIARSREIAAGLD